MLLLKLNTLLTKSILYIIISYYIYSKKNCKKKIGNYLFSHSLSSAFKCLTSLFGMGRGVST